MTTKGELMDLITFIETVSGKKLTDYQKACARGILVAKVEKETD